MMVIEKEFREVSDPPSSGILAAITDDDNDAGECAFRLRDGSWVSPFANTAIEESISEFLLKARFFVPKGTPKDSAHVMGSAASATMRGVRLNCPSCGRVVEFKVLSWKLLGCIIAEVVVVITWLVLRFVAHSAIIKVIGAIASLAGAVLILTMYLKREISGRCPHCNHKII